MQTSEATLRASLAYERSMMHRARHSPNSDGRAAEVAIRELRVLVLEKALAEHMVKRNTEWITKANTHNSAVGAHVLMHWRDND